MGIPSDPYPCTLYQECNKEITPNTYKGVSLMKALYHKPIQDN
jgi:hypothetical protein